MFRRTHRFIRARTLALTCLLGPLAGGSASAQSPQMFSPAWFGSAGRGVTAPTQRPGGVPAAAQAVPGSSAALSGSVRRSLTDFAAAASAVARAQSAQAAARAVRSASAVPDGLVPGGLQLSPTGVLSNLSAPSSTAASGRTTVTLTQTAPQASAAWSSFNVGPRTTLRFDQSAGGSAANTWVVLNRVTDPSTSPSLILGSIQAQGHVYVINPNGIIFGAGSQVNVGSLLVSTADLALPLSQGIYGTNVFQASKTADILVEAGAQIATSAPVSATDAGGSVLLFGSSVENDGAITTPNGQTVLASGQAFTLAPGYATTGDTFSTTRGTVVSATGPGRTTNTGVITATTGDITLFGQTVTQAGVAYATSSVATRGTIHLLTLPTDPLGSVTLAPGSVTRIDPDPDSGTALNGQRAQALTTLTGGPDSGSPGPQTSRIEIEAGNVVEFQGGSLTQANGGQIVATTGPALGGLPARSGRIQVDAGAVLDVSGLVGVTLPASANTLEVNIQGFEQRDAPVNRDTKLLNNANVFVDTSQLVLVPASTAYPTDRYYTGGGLLEVSGELDTVGHSIREWDTVGGTINLQTGAVVAAPGSVFNVSGGSINYQQGLVPTSYLVSSDGRIWNINSAPANLVYTGLYQGNRQVHPRWGLTEIDTDPLLSPQPISRGAMTVGRDAGSLTIGAPTVIFAGTIDASVITGGAQTGAQPASVTDPFLLPQTTAPLPGTLALQQAPAKTASDQTTPVITDVTIGAGTPASAVPATAAAPLPAAALNTVSLSAAALSSFGLGGLTIDVANGAYIAGGAPGVRGSVMQTAPLSLAPGGQLSIMAFGDVDVDSVTARAGSVGVAQLNPFASDPAVGNVALEANATLDLRGLWTNEELDPSRTAGAAFINGGSVSLASYAGLSLGAGSVIDVSGGAVLGPKGALTGGAGGSVSLIADQPPGGGFLPPSTPLVLSGQIRGYGVLGAATPGGTLTLKSPAVLIGDAATTNAAQNVLPQNVLSPSFFQQGFQNYDVIGYGNLTDASGAAIPGVAVAAGTALTVAAPVYQVGPATLGAPTGSDPANALSLGLPPLYLADPIAGTISQRAGASITLSEQAIPTPTRGGGVLIGLGASVAVDPGQAITVSASDQLTVLGSLTAPGGTMRLDNTGPVDAADLATGVLAGSNAGVAPGLSIWLGPDSRIDVAGRPVLARDVAGRPFGVVPAGGSVQIGDSASPAFIAVRPGAVVDASGASAAVDLFVGSAVPSSSPFTAPTDVQTVSSDGGAISLVSSSGIYLDGQLRAAGGGAGASGGSLSIGLYTPVIRNSYTLPTAPNTSLSTTIPNSVRVPAQITLSQVFPGSGLPASLDAGEPIPAGPSQPNLFARAAIGVDRIAAGGFASLSLATTDLISFNGDVALSLGRQLTLATAAFGDPSPVAKVSLRAPYVSIVPTPALVGDADPQFAFAASIQGQSVTAIAPKTPVCLVGAATCTASALTVSGDLVDISGKPLYGFDELVDLNQLPSGVTPQAPVDVPGFQQVTLASAGDLRFLGGQVVTPGNIALVAGQVYAATAETGVVEAGANLSPLSGSVFLNGTVVSLNSAAVLSIARAGGADPAAPLSAFGVLTLAGPTVTQGGVVRAPFGSLNFGYTVVGNPTNAISFLPGSVTSVSGAGLTVPYGGTTDNVNYGYDGGNIRQTLPGIAVYATQVSVGAGARLDLGGGGTLSGGGGETYSSDGTSLIGQGFVTGRGGSTDTLVTPLLAFSGAKLTSSPAPVTSTSATQIYAIVPGYASAYAPVTPLDQASNYAGSVPRTGESITLGAGVPGLAAGTYALLPSYYALLPGAFRVEVATGAHAALPQPVSLGNGSYRIDATLGIANTGISNPRFLVATVTPGSAVRDYSDYNETTYAAFVIADAAKFDSLRGYIPADAGALTLDFMAPAMGNAGGMGAGTPPPPMLAFSFAGTVDLQPAEGGFSGALDVTAGLQASAGLQGYASVPLEITGPGAMPTAGTVSIPAAALSAIGAPTLTVGSALQAPLNGAIGFAQTGNAGDITIGGGATLAAAQIFLIAPNSASITVEKGATLTTIGGANPPYDSTSGFAYENKDSFHGTSSGVLALSNGYLDFLPPFLADSPNGSTITVADGAHLLSGGTLAFSTAGSVSIDPTARYGAKYVDLAVQRINLGLPSGNAANTPVGLTLTPSLLGTLLAGDPTTGTPALQSLTLTAGSSLNVYGSVNFGATTGSLRNIVLNTPAIYGVGTSSDAAVLAAAGTLTWNGVTTGTGSDSVSAAPDAPVAGGPGTGAGTLTLAANKIVLGYTPDSQPQNELTLNRIILGFDAVNLTATQEITANNKSTLSVYQSASAPNASGTVTYAPAALTLTTPLLTADAGSTLSITTGGPIVLAAPAGASLGTASALGATVTLTGASIASTTAIGLPSGQLTLNATGNIALGAGSVTDLSGRSVAIFDQTETSGGGALIMESASGNITLDPTARIDVSATAAPAGSISATAENGAVALMGGISGGADAGFASGSIAVRAGTLAFGGTTQQATFSALNQTLTTGGVFGGRSFEVGSGDLSIGASDSVRARSVSISVDSGNLGVTGTIDASGQSPGDISLSANGALTLGGTAVLTTAASSLQTDSDQNPIDAANRGSITLTSAAGSVALAPGALLDLSSPDNVARGQVSIDVPRLGANAAALTAQGVTIQGAASVAINAFRTYATTDANGTVSQNGQTVGGVSLKSVDADNSAFINAALANQTFLAGIAGLTGPYASLLHLRPGVVITGSANSGGNLSVAGDLDLSGYRYASLNPGNGKVAGVTGSGEPGVLVLRAANSLLVGGSISDGFGAVNDPGDPNANGWQLNAGMGTLAQTVIVPAGLAKPVTLNGAATGIVYNQRLGQQIVTVFPSADVALNYPIQIRPATLLASVAIPIAVTLGAAGSGPPYVIPPGGYTTTAAITLPNGTTIQAGTILPAGTTLPTGTVLAAGSVVPFPVNVVPPKGSKVLTWPAGATLAVFGQDSAGDTGAVLAAPLQLTTGDIIPVGTNIGFTRTVTVQVLRPTGPNGTQGVLEPLAPLLSGVSSWSLDLVSGANTAAADPLAVVPLSALQGRAAGPNGAGSIALADTHITFQPGSAQEAAPAFSVIRTGTGTLNLAAAGSIVEDSPFSIYTAGTQPANETPVAGTYTPQGGGDLSVAAQRNIVGNQINGPPADPTFVGSAIMDWLSWQGGPGVPGSWSVSFGNLRYTGVLSGFIGLGTLGGGNVSVTAGGDVGQMAQAGPATSLDVTVASTGGVSGGAIMQQGGGNLTIDVDGAINPIPKINVPNVLDGTLTDMRGDLSIQAGSVGAINLVGDYGSVTDISPTVPLDPRSTSAYTAEIANWSGGVIVVPGDGKASIATRGDLVLGGAGDAILSSGVTRSAWFTLWRPGTAISLFSAGGNLTPTTQAQSDFTSTSIANDTPFGGNVYNYLYPPTLSAVAASGSIYYAGAAGQFGSPAIELAPSATGQLAFVAANSIYAAAYGTSQLSVDISGADPASIPTPLHPAYAIEGGPTNVLAHGVRGLFAFEADTPTTDAHASDHQPALFYAGSGDIVGLDTGQVINFGVGSGFTPSTWYVAGKPVQIRAGRDIVALGTSPTVGPTGSFNASGNFTSSVVFNDNASDISSIIAGRDIIYANESVAGPGLLFAQAGRNLYQGDQGVLESVGPQVGVTPSTQYSGAAITLLAGVGGAGPAWNAFASAYLDPTNLANPTTPLQDQPGKAVRNYDAQLVSYLEQRFGFTGTVTQARAFFAGLSPLQQDVFLLQIYFAELNQGGLDYNNQNSRFFQSYLEGTRAIDLLFPGTTNGQSNPAYAGSLTLFSGIGSGAASGQTVDGGIRTDFGGSITAVVPGGGITVGVQGVIPGSTPSSKPGIITQGTGDIDLYASGSVELGLSRIFTTFGGGILIWSENGDIAGGNGAKSTVVYAPALITYGPYGDITLSPTVPTTGAGIATLAPIPQVPRGDINLVSPNGVIDAGEAGIRASGNANFAARVIVNAANIQVQGKTSGLPTVAVPNASAQSAASAAAGAAGAAAEQALNRTHPEQPVPSDITVDVLGF